jgi:hypothetical protein
MLPRRSGCAEGLQPSPQEDASMSDLLRRALVAVAGLMAAAAGVAAEDLTITSTVSGGKTNTIQTQYLTASMSRTQTGDQDSIVEYDTGRLLIVDHKKKEYYETSFDEMAAMSRQLDAQVAQMPAFLQKRMSGGVGAVTMTQGTAPRRIAGYECTQYTLSMGKDMTYEIWATPAIALPVRYVDALKTPYAAMGQGGRKFVAMFDEMKKIKGFPLAFAMKYKVVGMSMDSLSEATEVKKGPIPASTFSVPAGYKKKDSPFKQK